MMPSKEQTFEATALGRMMAELQKFGGMDRQRATQFVDIVMPHILVAHEAECQRRERKKLELLRYKLRALPRHRATNTALWDGVQMNAALNVVDELIAALDQSTGEVR